jgi:Polysaccharide lyase
MRRSLSLIGAGIAVAALLVVSAQQAAALTSMLRPDGDVLKQWSGSAGAAWAALDDPVTQPASVPATDYIFAGAAGRVTEVAVGNVEFAGATGSATAWFHANTGADTQLRVDAVMAGVVRATTTVPAGSGFAWRALPAVSATQAETDDLRLRFTAVAGGDTNVRAAYVSLTAQTWQQTWSAPGNSVAEWNSLQMPADQPYRLSTAVPPVAENGTALRVEVRNGDVALNPAGQPIAGGWRAEAIGPTESASAQPVRYEWSTLFDASYPTNPTDADGNPIWQVITQWHQGDNDRPVGGSPPVALILANGKVWLHLNRPSPNDPNSVEEVGKYYVADMTPGTWHHFRVEVRWALSGGYVKVWHNGGTNPVQDRSNVQTLYPTSANPAMAGTATLKMGLYRKATPVAGQFVLYHDEVHRLAPQ